MSGVKARTRARAKNITIFTIGFSQKTVHVFFESLIQAGVKRLIDVRLNNTSQLAGFSKRNDLEYFLKQIANIGYAEAPLLRPTPSLLTAYRLKRFQWQDYEKRFLRLLKERGVQNQLSPSFLDGSCLLCSEAKPDQCHRRLAAEYLKIHWKTVDIRHL